MMRTTKPNPFVLSLSKHCASFFKLLKKEDSPLRLPACGSRSGRASTGSGRAVGVLLLGLLSTPAFAHPGHLHISGFSSGLLHPLTGLDHLAAMLMVGLWAGTMFRNRLIIPPLAFVIFMLVGFAYGATGGPLPLTELLILASVIVLGGMALFEVKPPLAIASAMIALFAFAHGHAHGAEMPAQASVLPFATGFGLMTALLHAAGIGLARVAGRPATRMVGGSVAALGLVWMLAP